MHAYEFKLETSERGELRFPLEIQKLLLQLKKARVILLIDDEGHGAEENRTASVLFKTKSSEQNTAYEDLPAAEIAKLAEAGGAFDFLAEPEEDIYSDEDLKVLYR